MKIGIDSLHFYIPKTYLPIEALANARGIEYAKLNKGLGLESMAVPDLNEDVATMAASAALRLIEQEELNPAEIGRIYLGTESALDAAKSTAAYVAEIVENNLEPKYGKRSLKNCDVVDLTFACIGAVDALENALDWVRANQRRKAIVIATDVAKYDLASTGEYTQGAGAVALLVSAKPRVLAIGERFGVAMRSVSDFFKPRRHFNKVDLLQKAAELLGTTIPAKDAYLLINSADDGFWNDLGIDVEIHKDEPVFDGPYSNDCYQERITEALEHFKAGKEFKVLENWHKLVFHLPYAFQGRRMITENWANWMKESGRKAELNEILSEQGLQDAEPAKQIKALSKSALYRAFVNEFIAQGETASSKIGNMYTASIFMSLLSMLVEANAQQEELSGKKIGFFSYGSGSKSKVFEGEVQEGWHAVVENIKLFETLAERQSISFEEYENWHKGKLSAPFNREEKITLNKIGQEGVTLGYRYYS